MDELLVDRLGDLRGAHAVSGYTETLASQVRLEAEGYAPEVWTDTRGYVIAHVLGDGPRIMVAVRLDEIGLMVSHVDDRGYLFLPSDPGKKR